MSRFGSEMSRFSGTRDGTNGGGHGGTLLRRVPLSDVPMSRAECPDEMSRRWPVQIHGVDCLLQRSGGGDVVMHDGRVIARAEQRFLAVARAATAFHMTSQGA